MDLKPRKRDEAIRALLELLAAGNAMAGKLVEKALELVLDRERLGSTAIGRGVAVPHARLDGLKDISIAFGQSAEGVAFNALDGELVYQVFLVIAPKDRTDQYLGVMERITRLVQNEDFRRFVSRAASGGEVLDLFKEMDG